MCICAMYCGSRQQIHQQENKALHLKEELVMVKESLQSTSLQKDVLQREKEELGLWQSFLPYCGSFSPAVNVAVIMFSVASVCLSVSLCVSVLIVL